MVSTSAVETSYTDRKGHVGVRRSHTAQKSLSIYTDFLVTMIRVTDQVVDALSETAQHLRLRVLNERKHRMNRVVWPSVLFLLLGCYMCFPRAWKCH